MSELDFFFVDEEMERLIDFALELEFQLIPNLNYTTPKPKILSDSRDIFKYAREVPIWFLVRDDFTKLPLTMTKVSGGPLSGKYFINQREGGPTIDIFWSGIQEKDSIRFVRLGNISHYPNYWNPDTETDVKAPEAQRAAYRELAQWIRHHSVESENPVSPNTRRRLRSVRIGEEAARQWAKGLQLGWEDLVRRPKRTPP